MTSNKTRTAAAAAAGVALGLGALMAQATTANAAPPPYAPTPAVISQQDGPLYHPANYPLEPDDGVISHSLDPDMPWM
ncbi:hypothetical protein EEB14_49330 [Rhodococcus sp. WS4]|nr:hypothetical protein EEB14_49330 [Rhodococcus sp. WS4]